eukprot:TRINITY_DN76242_c0_g1_i1.p1 TRINITY_DN76242_c0_g1~~TRINITY_DN76242_c0_g1_i1.p1  ORF type:complete len:712 (-),score=127.73 TRINITY_DN76242_c0_g1_i1:139-2274(-)
MAARSPRRASWAAPSRSTGDQAASTSSLPTATFAGHKEQRPPRPPASSISSSTAQTSSKSQGSRARGGFSRSATAPCPWCKQRVASFCCQRCLSRDSRQYNATGAAASKQAFQGGLEATLTKWHSRVTLGERRLELKTRVAELRKEFGQRLGAAKARQASLERRREALKERRKAHDTKAEEWRRERRRLEAKKSRISRHEFLRDPSQYMASLDAFHVFRELAVVHEALQAERRQKCSELLAIYPLRWMVTTEDAGAKGGLVEGERRRSSSEGTDRPPVQTVSLGQVQSFAVKGVLQEEEIKDMEAGLSYLVPLVSALAGYLDILLPFPCILALGHASRSTWRSQLAASSASLAATRLLPPTADTAASFVGGAPGGHACASSAPTNTGKLRPRSETFDSATSATSTTAGGGLATLTLPADGAMTSAMTSSHCEVLDDVQNFSAKPLQQERLSMATSEVALWTRPCVQHPYYGHWYHFTIYDGICTSEFASAMRLIDENLRQLCLSQGERPRSNAATLQLLAQLLSSKHFGGVGMMTAHVAAAALEAPGLTAASAASCGAAETSGTSASLASVRAGSKSALLDDAGAAHSAASVHYEGRAGVMETSGGFDACRSDYGPRGRVGSGRQRADTDSAIFTKAATQVSSNRWSPRQMWAAASTYSRTLAVTAFPGEGGGLGASFQGQGASASQGGGASSASMSVYTDGDWTVVEHEE